MKALPTLRPIWSRSAPTPDTGPVSAEQILEDFGKYIAQMQPKAELFATSRLAGHRRSHPGFPVGDGDSTIRLARRMAGDRVEWRWPLRILPTARWSTTSRCVSRGHTGHHTCSGRWRSRMTAPCRVSKLNSGYTKRYPVCRATRQGSRLYQDPASDYGRLSSAACSAPCGWWSIPASIRRGWNRDQVVEFMRQSAIDFHHPVGNGSLHRLALQPPRAWQAN
jgi:hypothetical protein